MKRGLLVWLVVAVLGAMQGWNISRAQTPDDENASEQRQFYSDVTLSSDLYTVTPEEQQEFPPEGGAISYTIRGPVGTRWEVVSNTFWATPSSNSGVIYHDLLPGIISVYAIPNDTTEPGRTGCLDFYFTDNLGSVYSVHRNYFQMKR